MRDTLVGALRVAVGAFVGYLVIALLMTLGLEVWLGGASWGSSLPKLLAGGLMGVVSGLLGGYAAAWIAGSRPVLGALGVWVFLLIDTTFVLTSSQFTEPAWFTLIGSATLFVTAAVGGLWRRSRLESRQSAAAG